MKTTKPIIILIPGHDTRIVAFKKKKYHTNKLTKITTPNVKSLMFDLPKWLLNDGFDVYLADFPNDAEGTPGVEKLASWFGKELSLLISRTKREVVIIGFSLGGLVARAYIDGPTYPKDKRQIGREFVKKVFLVAAPHKGTGYYRLMDLLIDFKHHPEQEACREFSSTKHMETFNRRYVHTNTRIPYYLIAGYGSTSLFGKLMNAFVWMTRHEQNDGSITISNATSLPEAFQVGVVEAGHVAEFGKSFFNETVPGTPSETYLKLIRPVLFEEKERWDPWEEIPSRSVSSWVFPVAFVTCSTVLTACIVRNIASRTGKRIQYTYAKRTAKHIR